MDVSFRRHMVSQITSTKVGLSNMVFLSHAADLNEREWSVIIRSNCLLNGYQVVPGLDKQPRKIERCAYNGTLLLQ